MGTNVFVGEYDRSVDGNGRLALPATFRDHLGNRCYVTAHPDGYIAITTEENFALMAELVLAEVRSGARPTSARRSVGRASQLASIDKQSRITLDEATRRHAGIRPGAQAIIVGALNELQVWRPSRFATVENEHGEIEPARVWRDEDDQGDDVQSGGSA
ncbi:MAG: hypothetical protein ABIP17_09375 [Ilumatobacteraceae bacterium]